MADPKFGEPVPADFKREKKGSERSVAPLNWNISEDTLGRIAKIEENTRKAEVQVGMLLRT